jgi:NAD(P)-dependent dehydrogenase (short-subunit alcohol dehydrogenase family)
MTGGRELDGRVALVTGGSGGLGRAIIEHLVEAGAQVAVCGGRRPDDLPPGALFLAADAQDPEAAAVPVTEVQAVHGRLDLVVNGGGVPVADAATVATTASLDIVRLTLLVPLAVAQAANRVMQGQEGGGAIVSLTSLGGIRPSPGSAVFGAAQAGLIHLTRTLAVEWAPKVRVNSVSFGQVSLEPGGGEGRAQPPVGRMGTARDVAAAVAFLGSSAAGYVTGANLVVHGGGERPAFLAAAAGERGGPASP